jgi:hypothetical protein
MSHGSSYGTILWMNLREVSESSFVVYPLLAKGLFLVAILLTPAL